MKNKKSHIAKNIDIRIFDSILFQKKKNRINYIKIVINDLI